MKKSLEETEETLRSYREHYEFISIEHAALNEHYIQNNKTIKRQAIPNYDESLKKQKIKTDHLEIPEETKFAEKDYDESTKNSVCEEQLDSNGKPQVIFD